MDAACFRPGGLEVGLSAFHGSASAALATCLKENISHAERESDSSNSHTYINTSQAIPTEPLQVSHRVVLKPALQPCSTAPLEQTSCLLPWR